MRLTERCHRYLEDAVNRGNLAIDATAGNGHDTVKLAELVGADGRVLAIDLQQQAIDAAQARLEAASVLERCELILGDHARVLKQFERDHAQQV
ncbi:MAG: methyltransferase domain-containing protein, partial [Coraliomargarita sp.]